MRPAHHIVAAFLTVLPVLALALAPASFAGPIIDRASTRVDAAGEAEPIVVRVDPRTTTFDRIAPELERIYGALTIDPGVPIEGDDIGQTIFTRDGGRVLSTNMGTDNVTVFDAATMAVLANVAVGDLPYGVECTNTYAIVACPFSNAVYVIRLSDYTIAAIISTGEQPWIVRTSPDGRYAYVATDVANTCEKIDLTTMTNVLTIPDFPIGITTFSFNSENGRFWVTFTDFEITPDGSQIVTGNWADSLLFYDTTTGEIAHEIPGVGICYSVEISGDGTRAVAISDASPLQVHQIDLDTHTKTASIALAGHQFGATWDIGVNADGSKVYASVSGNQSVIARFVTNDFITFNNTLSAFWIGTSPDHDLAISGQNYFSIVSFLTDSVLGQSIGNTQAGGAVSPVGARVVGFDPHRHEGLYFYDYANPNAPAYRGTTNVGEEPEGDCPRRVAIAPDGSKAVITNVLSDNATILDMETLAIEAIVPIGDRVQDIAITSDSRWAAICGFNSNALAILDLSTDTVVANVPCGTRPGVVSLTPDEEYAYVGDISSNTISVVRLAGAASARIAQIPCGEIGVVFAGYGIGSDVKVSPNGSAALVAVSFDDQVKVISTVTNTVVSTLPVGDFPIQIEFNGAGDYATVTNYFSNTVSVIHVTGAASTVVGTFARGSGPLRLDYNPLLGRIGVGNYTSKTLVHLDPQTGALLGTDSYAGWGNILQVQFDETGSPIVLTLSGATPPAHLHRGMDHVEIPVTPSFFDYNPAAQTAIVVTPGPDHVVVIRFDPAGAGEATMVPLIMPGALEAITPNPVRAGSLAHARFFLKAVAHVELALLDAGGREAYVMARGLYHAGENEVAIAADDLPSGTYFAVLRLDGVAAGARKITVLGL